MFYHFLKELLLLSSLAILCNCKKEAKPNPNTVPIGEKVTSHSSNYIVSTFAGSGIAGLADGNGTSAQFNWLDYTKHTPEIKWQYNSLALDAARNLYVADAGNFAIRKITPAGVVSTVAGGSEGTADGNGRNAQFSLIISLVVDAVGDVYVAERTRIRKISLSGDVTTFAGSLTRGLIDSNGTSAKFNEISAITIGKDGNLYVCDRFYPYPYVRKITPDGTVTTYLMNVGNVHTYTSIIADSNNNILLIGNARSGDYILSVTSSQLVTKTRIEKFTPTAFTINKTGEIYVIGFRDNSGPSYTNIYQMISPVGYIALADNKLMGFADGVGHAAKFQTARGIAADDFGNVYVGDPENFRVRKIRKL